jgi:hypothetical protein
MSKLKHGLSTIAAALIIVTSVTEVGDTTPDPGASFTETELARDQGPELEVLRSTRSVGTIEKGALESAAAQLHVDVYGVHEGLQDFVALEGYKPLDALATAFEQLPYWRTARTTLIACNEQQQLFEQVVIVKGATAKWESLLSFPETFSATPASLASHRNSPSAVVSYTWTEHHPSNLGYFSLSPGQAVARKAMSFREGKAITEPTPRPASVGSVTCAITKERPDSAPSTEMLTRIPHTSPNLQGYLYTDKTGMPWRLSVGDQSGAWALSWSYKTNESEQAKNRFDAVLAESVSSGDSLVNLQRTVVSEPGLSPSEKVALIASFKFSDGSVKFIGAGVVGDEIRVMEETRPAPH